MKELKRKGRVQRPREQWRAPKVVEITTSGVTSGEICYAFGESQKVAIEAPQACLASTGGGFQLVDRGDDVYRDTGCNFGQKPIQHCS